MSVLINSPFTRFRHGTEMRIEPNIRESIIIFLEQFDVNSEKVFNTLVTDIADGSGPGIGKESTWFQAIKELFDHLRDYSPAIRSQVVSKYLEFLKILSVKSSSDELWDTIKLFFTENMDILSLWKFSHYRSMLERTNPFRDKDGKVYESEAFDDKEIEVEVLDGQTLAEARYSYITEDVYSKYGSVGLLLRLARLVFIQNALYDQTDDYSFVRFVMSEDSSGYSTWFLQGYWQVHAAKRERAIRWHPKDCFTDLFWLESDISLKVAASADEQAKETTHPSSPVITEESDQVLFQKSVHGYRLQYEVSLDTNIFIADSRDNLPDEIYIDFENRLIRWVNGSIHRCPVLIIPTNDETLEEAISIAKRFISLLIFENSYTSIRENANVGHPVNYYPAMIRQPRLPSITSISSEFINKTAVSKSKNAWIALSFYKEAKNSDSIFYEMYNYYKIIQAVFLKADGTEDKDACIRWLDSEIKKLPTTQEKKDLTTETQSFNTKRGLSISIGGFINHVFRDSVAHVGKLTARDKVRGVPTINPDDLEDARRFRKIIFIVELLARETITQGLHN